MKRTFLSAVLTALMSWTVALHADGSADGPNPDLSPDQVVAAMLDAMKQDTDEGIAQLFEFASPKNKQQTGPLDRFTAMMREHFPDMLGHDRSRVAPPLIDQNRAMIPIQLQSKEGIVSEYVVLLSRQEEGPCTGCWMTDAVFPPEVLDHMPPDELEDEKEEPGV